MNYYNKAFTLVELIVTIAILAILATIAFISLQWYAQTAKNSKVWQDLNTLANTIQIWITKWMMSNIEDLVKWDRIAINGISAWSVITVYDNDKKASTWSLDNISINYKVGTVDFKTLRQNGDDFKDSDNNDYVLSIAYSWASVFYQVAGQQVANSGEYIAIVKWNYIAQPWDTLGLISHNGSSIGIVNNQNLGLKKNNTNLYPN